MNTTVLPSVTPVVIMGMILGHLGILYKVRPGGRSRKQRGILVTIPGSIAPPGLVFDNNA